MFGGLCRVILPSLKRMSAERPCARASTLRAQAKRMTLLGGGTRDYAGLAALSAYEAAVKRGTGGGGA